MVGPMNKTNVTAKGKIAAVTIPSVRIPIKDKKDTLSKRCEGDKT